MGLGGLGRRAHLVAVALVGMLVVSISGGPLVNSPAQAATLSFKQGNAREITSGTVNSVAFTNANQAGNLIVVYAVWGNTGSVTLRDSRGNAYVSAQAVTTWGSGNTWRAQVLYAKNIAAGANTVTATFSSSVSGSFGMVYIHEYAGIDQVNPLDVSKSAKGSGTALNSGSATTTNANDLIFGAGAVAGTISSAGAGFTTRSAFAGNRTMDKSVTAAGPYNATATANSSGRWVMQMVAFKADTGADTTPPSTPANLAATATSSAQVNLSWNASTDNVGATGYQIERCQGTGCSNFSLVTTVPGTSYSNTGLSPSTSYSYRVRATDSAGNLSGYSNVATASTLPDTTAPSVPTNLTLQVVSSTQINLDWNPSTDDVAVAGYRVYRDGTFLRSSSVMPVQDSGLTPSTTYSYAVSAYDAAGNESARTAPAGATTPASDTTSPSAAMAAPTSGSTVSGTVTVSATATDNVAVADVDFLLDGVSIGVDSTAPYSVQWNTTTTSNGLHSLSARARDTSGNFGVTSGVVSVTVSNPAVPPLPAGLVAGWNFNENSGTTAADATSNANTATLVNGASWSAGKYGSGMRVNGNSQYLSIANSASINLAGNAMAFSAWVNPVAEAGDRVLFGKFYNSTMTSPYYQYGLELRNTSNTPVFEIGTSGGALEASMGSGLAAGQWTHLAVVFNGSQVQFYTNGTLTSTVAISASITARSAPMYLGADISPNQFLNGTLDDVRLYNRTLTQAEVQTDMNTPLAAVVDPSAPTVAITAPANGAQVSGTTTVLADAGDDVGVAGVQFFVDGNVLGPEDTTAPYGANWDTRPFSNGAHTLTARARDAGGRVTVSTPINVNVINSDYFQNEILATGLDLPTAMKFLPDGRMLVAELQGRIKVIPAPYTTPDPALFLQIATGASGVQQGIFDLALDPNFTTNHYYYIFYTAPDGHDQLSRFTANAALTGTLSGSELVLYRDPESAHAEHHGGAITFANDGKLMLTTGEHFNAPLSQDLSSPRGKILRFNPDGTVPTDNPFYDGAGPHYDAIWALGLRNPYRAYYDSPTGRLFIGDVGGNDPSTAQEEVNLGVRGANYGWPNSEGACSAPCSGPLYSYPHNGRDASVTGGFVYHGSKFPASMQGNYFFADYAQNWIKRLTLDASGIVTGVFNFEPADGTPDGPTGDVVYLTEGPDGALYYLDLGYSDITGTYSISKIRRIRYQQVNQAPIAIAGANPASGPLPLNVAFSSAGSSDPEGQPITYAWDFGDGATSTAANPSHTYAVAGSYTVRLTVSDGVNSTFAPPIAIAAGSPPTATINGPADGSTFRAGNVIAFSGSATDPEDGALPASAFSWSIDFLHDGHVHPAQTLNGATSGSFTIPTSGHDFSGNTRYRITLTVTDTSGLRDTKSVIVWPEKVNLTFNTAPATGLTLFLDGIAKTAPFTYDTLIGFSHTIEARSQTVGNTNYAFSAWSDGGAQTHALIVPAADQSYTATYTASPAPPNGLAAAWGFNEASGGTSADSSGNSNTATLLNGVGRIAGKYGNGLSLDGTNDYLSAADSTSLNISGNALTLSMWLKPAGGAGDQVLLGKHWNTSMTSPYYQYGVELQSGATTPVFQIGTTSGVQSVSMGSAVSTAQWSHLAIVFNGTTVKFYVNGALVSTQNLSATITARPNPLRMGADADTSQFYQGLLDDVRIYNRAQTAAEIQADMNTGL